MKFEKRPQALRQIVFFLILLLISAACSPKPQYERVLSVELVQPQSAVTQGHNFDVQLKLKNSGKYNVP